MKEVSADIWNVRGLSNENEVSFINVCLQSLFHSTTIRRILTEHNVNDLLKNVFNQYVSKSEVKVRDFAEYISDNNFDSFDKNPSEILINIFRKSAL